jgi:cation diffusion facilitator CzcD-associated flavoprotein CzcO
MTDVIVIGAGFGGIGTAIQLKRAGITDFAVLEKASDVGGTWRENAYPGCACDVPSHLYSFSYELNPAWSRVFAPREEIWEYLRHCVQKYQLEPHIQYGVRVDRLDWDDDQYVWHVTTATGDTLTAKAVVLATGPLHIPSYPDVPGRETFGGTSFHSSAWDSSCDLHGKRVAVVGTGASAIQFIPHVARQASKLYVFQRTPAWIHPRPDAEIPLKWRRRFEAMPFLMRLFRAGIYWGLEARGMGFAVHPKLMRMHEAIARRHLERQVSDPELRKKLTPDYTIGCKRIVLSSDYYPTLCEPHVELVTEGIERITQSGVVTGDGRHIEVDVLIYGTGFKVVSGLMEQRITGKGGRTIQEAWRDGVKAYHGISVAGFPNLFMLLGPNTGSGHTSVVFSIEVQVQHIVRLLRRLKKANADSVEVKEDVQRRFNSRLHRRLRRAVWSAGGCRSWYLDEHGVNRSLWPGFSFEYWLRARRPARLAYHMSSARPRERDIVLSR